MLESVLKSATDAWLALQKSGWEAQVLGAFWTMLYLVSTYSARRVWARVAGRAPPSELCADLLAKMATLPSLSPEPELEGGTGLCWETFWVELDSKNKVSEVVVLGEGPDPMVHLEGDLSPSDRLHVEKRCLELLEQIAAGEKEWRHACLKNEQTRGRWASALGRVRQDVAMVKRMLEEFAKENGKAMAHCPKCGWTGDSGQPCFCEKSAEGGSSSGAPPGDPCCQQTQPVLDKANMTLAGQPPGLAAARRVLMAQSNTGKVPEIPRVKQ
jgi:hypothetical protein